MKKIFLTISFVLYVLFGLQTAKAQQVFTHPGILHTMTALNRMRDMVKAGKEPWKSGFEKLKDNPKASFNYRVEGPFDSVSRDLTKHLHTAEIEHDCDAAYYNALMWYITGNEAHAKKAIEILNAWSVHLKAILPRDAELLAGLDGDQLVNAAEIVRYTYKGWKPEEIARSEHMFKDVFYPIIKNFAEHANGNWGNACIKTTMGIGIFVNDREIFQRGVDYYYNGKGDGSLPNYVINEDGECQESGRDQGHSQLGLANLAEAAEIGYNQGLDMYSALNNRLLKGFEYSAKYNLGMPVPFTPSVDQTKKYKQDTISSIDRGHFRPVFEMIYNHYQVLKGIPAPYTKQVADKIRPEADGPRPLDQPGYGTLLFSLSDKKK